MIPPPRSIDQAQDGLLSLLPDGWAATRDRDDYEGALFRPLGQEISLIETSITSMLPQIDPRQAPNLLPDWERLLGPDPCQAANPITDTVTRGLIAYERLTNRGTICAGYFERYALSIGETIAITEFPASICGMSKCGDALNPPPGQCNILVTLGSVTVSTAICGVSTCGDSLGTFDHSVMECVIRQGVPLQVTPYFSYTG